MTLRASKYLLQDPRLNIPKNFASYALMCVLAYAGAAQLNGWLPSFLSLLLMAWLTNSSMSAQRAGLPGLLVAASSTLAGFQALLYFNPTLYIGYSLVSVLLCFLPGYIFSKTRGLGYIFSSVFFALFWVILELLFGANIFFGKFANPAMSLGYNYSFFNLLNYIPAFSVYFVTLLAVLFAFFMIRLRFMLFIPVIIVPLFAFKSTADKLSQYLEAETHLGIVQANPDRQNYLNAKSNAKDERAIFELYNSLTSKLPDNIVPILPETAFPNAYVNDNRTYNLKLSNTRFVTGIMQAPILGGLPFNGAAYIESNRLIGSFVGKSKLIPFAEDQVLPANPSNRILNIGKIKASTYICWEIAFGNMIFNDSQNINPNALILISSNLFSRSQETNNYIAKMALMRARENRLDTFFVSPSGPSFIYAEKDHSITIVPFATPKVISKAPQLLTSKGYDYNGYKITYYTLFFLAAFLLIYSLHQARKIGRPWRVGQRWGYP